MKISKNTESLKLAIEKLLSLKIVKPNGCWGIPNLPERTGYVRLEVNDRAFLIHRVSAWYYLDLDYDNFSQLALHKNECNNRTCWNPEHLYVGSYRNNLDDAIERGKQTFGETQKRKTHCPQGHEYSKSNTYINKVGSRQCKECTRIRARNYYRNKKVS